MKQDPLPAPVIVIFGITGDLSRRKLLPALYHLFANNMLPSDTKIIGSSRHKLTKEELLKTIELCVLEKDKVCDPEGLKKVSGSLDTIQLDPTSDEDYDKLKALLDSYDKGSKRIRLYYMSIPASAYEPIVNNLKNHGLNDERSRLLIEKPFGYDLSSAQKSIEVVHEAFKEEQIYRIDHYLAKETAQNLLTFRLHNPIFSPLWNCRYIQKVHVRQFETIGVEGRANFYEQTGALRDMIQSHLMQLLAITLMDLPKDMGSQAIHQAKQQFFNALEVARPEDVIRAQYDGYKEEVGNPDSQVETYVRLQLRHTPSTWQDTEIILEHGKAMAESIADVTIEFKSEHEKRRNRLIFQIQPDEGISLGLYVKEPGFENRMHQAILEFHYQDSLKDYAFVDAYERVLMDALKGDQSLFAADEEVLATWRVLQPILDGWAKSKQDLRTYSAGSKTL